MKYKLVQPLMENSRWFFKKLKIGLSFDPIILLLGVYLKKMKMLTLKDICTLMFIAGVFTIAKTGKQPKCPSRDE